MWLEQIAKQYGMTDYLDHNTGKIYQMSKAIQDTDGTLLVPVVSIYGDGILKGMQGCRKLRCN